MGAASPPKRAKQEEFHYEMNAITRKLERDYPEANKGRDVKLTYVYQIVLRE